MAGTPRSAMRSFGAKGRMHASHSTDSDSTDRWRRRRSPPPSPSGSSRGVGRPNDIGLTIEGTEEEAYSMNMYLSDDTTFPHHTPPTKGKFWDFAVAAVAVSTDESVWKFPKNAAIIMIVDCDVKPPHGVILHRLIQKDQDPFSHSIAVAVKDTVRQVVSQGSLEWPCYSKWTSGAGNTPSPVGSRCCPGVHRVRLSLRTDSFYDEMVEHIDVGIVVAAERFSLLLWEEAAEHMDNCIVRIVTTRGGGGVNDMDMSMAAVAAPFAKAIDKVVNRNASNDIFTRVGHTTPIHPSSLSVKGKKWEKHESVPMLWISCHHSVRLFPDQNAKGKHKGKDKGKAKGKGKLNDRGGGK